MKKNELSQLVIGSSIESKKTGEVLVINNIVEVEGKVKYQLSNDKSTTQSSLLRWYNLIPQEVVEQIEVEEVVIPETTVEELDKLVEQEAKNIKLTPLETEAMWILKNNEYEDCFDREPYEDGTFWYRSAWCFSVIEGLSCGVQSAKGVLSSLVKKGLVIVDEGEYNYNSKQYDSSVYLTDLGYVVGTKALENYNPDEVNPAVENEEQPPVKPTPQPTPVEVKPVETKPSNNLSEQIFEYCNNHQDIYTVKHNKDHSVVKGLNKKNLVEIYASKKAINIAVRHQLFTEEEQMVLDNCRIVGNGTYVLDLKFQIHSLDEFIDALNRAVQYIPTKSKK